MKFNKLVSSVRAKGLEPPRLTAPDPKSGAATNYATRALLWVSECKGKQKKWITKLFVIILTQKVFRTFPQGFLGKGYQAPRTSQYDDGRKRDAQGSREM